MKVIVKGTGGRVLSFDEICEIFEFRRNPLDRSNSIVEVDPKKYQAFREAITSAGCTIEKSPPFTDE